VDTLTANQQLNVNDQLESANGSARLVMQGDGNLVLYRQDNGNAIWASNTVGKGVTYAILQADGNFVAYDANNQPWWATGTEGSPGAAVTLEDDGNLVLAVAGQNPLWTSGTAVMPTPADVTQVQTNLQAMQALNDYVYNQSTAKVLNAYLLLSESDGSDPGLTVGLNILEGAFWALGSELGPIGNFAASFLSGMVSWWATSTPPSLNTTFANMLTRLQATSQAVDMQLAVYYQNVVADWDTSFTYNGSTANLSDLAAGNFPVETDPAFETAAAAALFALDQQIWASVMVARYVITQWELSSGPVIMSGSEDQPPIGYDESFIAAHPAYTNTWVWHNSSGCGDTTGWEVTEYNIGTGAGVFSDGSMGHDACNYLFIDSAPGVVINPAGLFTRETVFTGLGIRQTTYIVSVGGGGGVAGRVSLEYLRSMRAGQTISQLIEREGRESVQQRIIDRAQRDRVFATSLAHRPRQAIESLLGVRIPEVVSVSAIVETPGVFAVVVPQPPPAG
jgi:hypothetical protein